MKPISHAHLASIIRCSFVDKVWNCFHLATPVYQNSSNPRVENVAIMSEYGARAQDSPALTATN
jgi:hypothetical protein